MNQLGCWIGKMSSIRTAARSCKVMLGVLLGLVALSSAARADDYKEMVAMGWWNALSPEQMVAALFGDEATADQEAAAKKMYMDLDAMTKMLVDDAAAEIYGQGGHQSVGAWWETLDCRKMRIAAGDGNMADSSSPFCAHYPGSGSSKLLGEEAMAEVNRIGVALLGRDDGDVGVYPPNHAVAMRWWNALNPEQMVAALFGDEATMEQEAAAKNMYGGLDQITRGLVNAAATELYGDGDFASVGVWWETLDCRKMRIAAGDGNMADSSSPYCAHYPGSGVAKILEEMYKDHVDEIGMAMLGKMYPGTYPTPYTIPLFPAATDMPDRHGFARVVNRGGRAVEAHIMAYDDAGMAYGPVMLMIDAHSARQFNAEDLEMGNMDKGLSGGVGSGEGHWRLVITSTLPLKATGYVRTGEGFVTSVQDTVPGGMTGHLVNFFNPASNYNQASVLRIVNPGERQAYVRIEGTDDHNMSPGSAVDVMVPPGASHMITAGMLESGGDGMEGALGDGMGKWRLRVTSPQRIMVMSLMDNMLTGDLTNLSTAQNH